MYKNIRSCLLISLICLAPMQSKAFEWTKEALGLIAGSGIVAGIGGMVIGSLWTSRSDYAHWHHELSEASHRVNVVQRDYKQVYDTITEITYPDEKIEILKDLCRRNNASWDQIHNQIENNIRSIEHHCTKTDCNRRDQQIPEELRKKFELLIPEQKKALQILYNLAEGLTIHKSFIELALHNEKNTNYDDMKKYSDKFPLTTTVNEMSNEVDALTKNIRIAEQECFKMGCSDKQCSIIETSKSRIRLLNKKQEMIIKTPEFSVERVRREHLAKETEQLAREKAFFEKEKEKEARLKEEEKRERVRQKAKLAKYQSQPLRDEIRKQNQLIEQKNEKIQGLHDKINKLENEIKLLKAQKQNVTSLLSRSSNPDAALRKQLEDTQEELNQVREEQKNVRETIKCLIAELRASLRSPFAPDYLEHRSLEDEEIKALWDIIKNAEQAAQTIEANL